MKEEQKYRLTIPQENIWIMEKFIEDSNVNNILGLLTIPKKLDVEILKQAIQNVIKQNEVYKTRIIEEAGKAYQYFTTEETKDNIEVCSAKNQEELDRMLNKINEKRFSILKSKLYEFSIIEENQNTHICMKMHHIISDAWTLGQVVEQIKKSYVSIQKNENLDLKESYVKYINKNEMYVTSEKYQKDKEYWNKYIEDIKPINNYPVVKTYKSNRVIKGLDESLMEKVQKYCKENKVSEYTFFLGIVSTYFMKAFGQDEIVVGTPYLNRSKKDKELDILGMFIATLPIKVKMDIKNQTFVELLEELSHTNKSCYKHAMYSYLDIQKEFQEVHDTSVNLYEVCFSYQINKVHEEIDGILGKTDWIHNGSQTNPILISYMNHFGENKLCYDYLSHLFNEEEITNINDRLVLMIENIVEEKSVKLSEISIVSKEDVTKLIEFNNTGEFKSTGNIISTFRKIVGEHKDEVAVKCGDDEITYLELEEKTNIIAQNLIEKGVTTNTPVALVFNKTLEMIITMLGVLKTGGYYVPVLPEEEKTRMNYIIKNSFSKYIITNIEDVSNIENKEAILKVEDLLNGKEGSQVNVEIKEDAISYLIYTSGTTGNPKGVMIKHENVVSFVDSLNADDVMKFKEGDVSISVLKYSFDASAIDIFVSLLNGGKLVLVPKEIELNPKEVAKLFEKEKVTRFYTVHKWIEAVQAYSDIENLSLRLIGAGGEVLKPKTFEKLTTLNPNIQLYNVYRTNRSYNVYNSTQS